MNRLRVVVAEDNETIREYIVMLLSQQFHVVEAVPDGMHLLAAAIELCPDVIVSDINMPELSGPRAMEELKLQRFDIPFVFISADFPHYENLNAAFVSKARMGRDLVPAVYKAFHGTPDT